MSEDNKRLKWEVKVHNYPIADTGDYDGYFEITNGSISIATRDDINEDLLWIICNRLNDADCDFIMEDFVQYENYLLKEDIKDYRKHLQEFVDRVDRGEIKSVKTYGAFKEMLDHMVDHPKPTKLYTKEEVSKLMDEANDYATNQKRWDMTYDVFKEHALANSRRFRKGPIEERSKRTSDAPPLGLKPIWVHHEQRLAEINVAIERYKDFEKEIPEEWIAEKQTLESWLQNRK